MKSLMQYIIIASSFLCNYGWSMNTELPLHLDIATSEALEPAILVSPALEISIENQYSDIDIFTEECAAHLQQNDAKFVQDKKEILEHELHQSDNEQRSAAIKEQIEIIDGLLESKQMHTQKDTPYISNKDEKIGESSSSPDSSYLSSLSLVKEMILQDKLIGACFDHIKQGNTKAVQDKRAILMHELSQCDHALFGETLRRQIQALDTMIQQPDIHKFSQIFHTGEQSSNSSSKPNLAQQTLNRIRQAAQHNRQTSSHKAKHNNALPLSKSQDGKLYIKIDGVKTYVSEGKHVSISGNDWVVIGNGVFPIGVGQARIDKNGSCHIKDLNGKLHCLANHKWIAWANGTIYLYQNQQLQMIPNRTSITIDGKQLINIDGKLCEPQAPYSTSSTIQNADSVSTPVNPVSNISKEVDVKIQTTLNELTKQNTDFKKYMQTIGSVLQNMKDQGLLTPTSEAILTPEVLEAIAHCPKYFIDQFKFDDPREHPHEFIEGVIKYGVYATFHIVTDGAFLGLEKLSVIGTQVYTLLQTTDFSSMSPIQKAEFITKQIAETIKAVLADQIGRKIIPKAKPTRLPHSSSSSTSSMRDVHEAVTPEGVKIRVSATESDSSLLKNKSNKPIVGSIQRIPDYVKENRIPLDRETILADPSFNKTRIQRVKGAAVYERNNMYYHRDTFHTGKGAHLEVYNKQGAHLGEANPLTGELIQGTMDKLKSIKKLL